MQFKQQYSESAKEFDKDSYRTPPEIFEPLNEVFSFETDVAATDENTLCPFYFTEEMDALSMDWTDMGPCWCNPPYSNGHYGKFIRKAYQEWTKSRVWAALIIPASLETKHFGPVWRSARYLIVPHKRVSYLDPEGNPVKGNSFLSAIVIFCDWTLQVEQGLRRYAKGIGNIIDLQKGLLR